MADIGIQKMADEQTFLMVKPEGVQRGLVGEIISRFEKKGFKLVAMKFVHVSLKHFAHSNVINTSYQLTLSN